MMNRDQSKEERAEAAMREKAEQGNPDAEPDALLPCPFCGGRATFLFSCSLWFVKCEGCGTRFNSYKQNKPAAAGLWNRRAPTDGECPALVELKDKFLLDGVTPRYLPDWARVACETCPHLAAASQLEQARAERDELRARVDAELKAALGMWRTLAQIDQRQPDNDSRRAAKRVEELLDWLGTQPEEGER